MPAGRARKRFGQHFLHDPGVIRRIVEAIGPAEGQAILEIGPGRGAITEALIAAVEINGAEGELLLFLLLVFALSGHPGSGRRNRGSTNVGGNPFRT